MEITKFLHFFTLIFLAYNLAMLWEESSTVNYRFLNETKEVDDEKTKFTLCLPISELSGGAPIQLPNFKPTNYSESNFNVADFLSKTVPLLNEELRRIYGLKDAFVLEQSCVFNRHACLRILPKHLTTLNSFYEFTYKMYVQIEDYRLFFSEFYYSNIRRLNMVRLMKVYRLNILNNQLNVNLNKFNCMNACLKKRARKAIYLYEWNDSKPINLSLNNAEDRDLNGEKQCDQECTEKSLLMVYFLVVVETPKNSYVNVTADIQMQNVFYVTYQSFSTADLLVQAAGLITLIINMNINQTVPALFKLAFKRYLRTALFRRIYPKMKMLLLIFSSIVVFEMAFDLYSDHKHSLNYPLETKISNYSLSSTPFALAFCIPVKILLLNANFSRRIGGMSEDQILSSYSYDEIEKHTESDLYEYVQETYLSFGNRKFHWNLKSSGKIFFKNCSYKDPFHDVVHYNFSRCFKVDINLVEHRYQSLLAISNFVIEFRTTKPNFDPSLNVVVYLLEEREIFNSRTFELEGDYMVLSKRSIKSKNSRSYNCSDYSTSRHSSIDECINETFLKRHNSFPAYGVLDKSQFPNYIYSRRRFNTTVDDEIVAECESKSKRIDCRMTLFRASYNKIQKMYVGKNVNLYYEMIEYVEVEPSWQKLALSCSNLASIFFSTNARKFLLTASFVVIRLVLRLKWRKWFKHIVFLICFLGFLVHGKNIFETIINSDLSQNAYYRKNESILFPDLVLCFKDFADEQTKQEMLDEHHKLTGNYLNKMTLKLEDKIQKIRYLNASGSYEDFDLFDSPNELFGIKTFLYQDIKCIEISPNMVYRDEDLFFQVDPYVLKIYLHRTLQYRHLDETEIVYFLTKKRGTKQFNQVYKLDSNRCMAAQCVFYRIKLELFEITVYDRFKYLKSPIAMFLPEVPINEASAYLNSMQDFFKNSFNLNTRAIPFYDFDDAEIDDALFEQLYLQVQNQTDHNYPHNRNCDFQIYSSYHTMMYADINHPTLEFYASPFIQRTLISNDDNFGKLVQSILNSLSLWVDLSILDINLYISKALNSCVLIYGALRSLKGKLQPMLSK